MTKKNLIHLPPKVILSGGGTGGHLYPALAIAEGLKEKIPQIDILFVGALGKIEMQKVAERNFPIKGLWISGFSKKISLDALIFPIKLLHSLWESLKIIKKFSPDLIIGTGGYASGPLLFMGYFFRIPICIQEQNSFPGKTNKILGRGASRIFTAYKEACNYFPKNKIILSGNPTRRDFHLLLSKKQACQKLGLDESKPIILSLGGSGGAKNINDTWSEKIELLKANKIQLIWQVGKKNYTEAKNNLALSDPSILLFEFIEEMLLAYSAADIIISRAGALSISELALVGKPSIFVPYPFASGDHQKKNAQILLNKEAALLIEDHELKENLIEKSLKLLKNEKLKEKLSKNIKKFATPLALEKIVSECIKLIPSHAKKF